jgi:hypothetical protein
MTDVFYNDLSLDQLHAIHVGPEIRAIIEAEPLRPVSEASFNRKIEGMVTRPRHGFEHFHRPPTVYWRRAVPREEAGYYDRIDDEGDEDDLGNNAYDHIVLYRSLTADEKITFKKLFVGVMVVSVRHNRDLVPHFRSWYVGPT